MNKEELQARITEIDSQIVLFSNSLNALQGARQECGFWLNKIDEKEKKEKEDAAKANSTVDENLQQNLDSQDNESAT